MDLDAGKGKMTDCRYLSTCTSGTFVESPTVEDNGRLDQVLVVTSSVVRGIVRSSSVMD